MALIHYYYAIVTIVRASSNAGVYQFVCLSYALAERRLNNAF